MEKWKQKLGSSATYNNLIGVFERAGYKSYADTVKNLMKNVEIDADNSDRITRNQTPPPSEQSLPQLPVFPPEPEQVSEPPQYAIAAGVKLLQEDDQLGTKEVVSIWGYRHRWHIYY